MAGKYDDMSFKKAFAAARKAQGSGKVFTWKGKRYTTNTKEDEAKKKVTKPKPRPKSGAAKKTVKPKKRPGSGEPRIAKPSEIVRSEEITVTKLLPVNSKKRTPSFRNRPLKIPAAVTNKIKKIDSDIKKISIGEREAASKRLESTKKKLAELRNKKVDKNPGSKIDEILDSLTKLGLYIKDLSKGGGVPGVRKRRKEKPTVKFGSGGR
jgi:hypothetical protein|tara:strand:+ start:364 stop:990 length:627 start_codon:yes stop_codon:yes gene_type:complete